MVARQRSPKDILMIIEPLKRQRSACIPVVLLCALSSSVAVGCSSVRATSQAPVQPLAPKAVAREPAQHPVEPQGSKVLVMASPAPEHRVTLTVPPVTKSHLGCQLIEHVSGQSVSFAFPREGEPAQVSFANDLFLGTLKDGVLDISYHGSFEWSDGCTWKTIQRIYGTLASATLYYTYFESPLPKQSGCASSCSGAAEVRVEFAE